ncbi:MAG: helix-turn-helix domain-containing protein [Firmicutes bacterium]|nr:helix-turn-helix domain-containing protein [Bacillota bacterium]
MKKALPRTSLLWYTYGVNMFAERLFDLRRQMNLSQGGLAKATGVSQAAITYWENALRLPNLTAIISLARFFGVPSDYLIGLVDCLPATD